MEGIKNRFETVNNSMMQLLSYLMNVQHTDAPTRAHVQKLLKYVYHTEAYETQPDFTLTNVRELIMDKHIRGVPFVPDSGHLITAVVCYFDGFYLSENKEFITNKLIIDVLVPLAHWLTPQGLKPFIIMNEIDNLIDGVNIGGIGVLELESVTSLVINNDVVGYSMMYNTLDFAGV